MHQSSGHSGQCLRGPGVQSQRSEECAQPGASWLHLWHQLRARAVLSVEAAEVSKPEPSPRGAGGSQPAESQVVVLDDWSRWRCRESSMGRQER